MAWIARDVDESLFIYACKPCRDIKKFYAELDDDFGIASDYIELPSDTDEKLIGRHITWEDEPVEI